MSYISIVVAAIAQVIIGALWFGPLFGKSWMRLSGNKPSPKKNMTLSYILMFIGSLLMAYALKIVIIQFPFTTKMGVAFTALLIWLGFIAPVQLGTVLWQGKSWKLYSLNVLYYLVSLVVMALILLLL